MSILILVLLGLLQGLCEFLPISSSGHLVLFSKIFKQEDSLFVSIILHSATLLALIIVMRKEIWQLIRHPFSKEAMNIVIATICTCVVALILMPIISTSFEGALLPFCFLLSAILLLVSEKFSKGNKNIDFKQAIIIGLAQGVAVLPGLSRSGTTLSTALLSGCKRDEAGKFSFLISLPIIVASLLMEIVKVVVYKESISVNPIGLGLGFLVAFIVGLVTIKFMLRLTAKLKFKVFAVELILMAILSAIIIW